MLFSSTSLAMEGADKTEAKDMYLSIQSIQSEASAFIEKRLLRDMEGLDCRLKMLHH